MKRAGRGSPLSVLKNGIFRRFQTLIARGRTTTPPQAFKPGKEKKVAGYNKQNYFVNL